MKKNTSTDQNLYLTEKPKKGRWKSFEVKISFDSGEKTINFQLDNHILAMIFKANSFVTQKNLERILTELRISDRNREIRLRSFFLQLEIEPSPTWFGYLTTESVTTARRLASSLSNALFQKGSRIDSRIQAKVCPEGKKKLDSKKRRRILGSEWYPGYVSSEILEVQKLLKVEEILDELKIPDNEWWEYFCTDKIFMKSLIAKFHQQSKKIERKEQKYDSSEDSMQQAIESPQFVYESFELEREKDIQDEKKEERKKAITN